MEVTVSVDPHPPPPGAQAWVKGQGPAVSPPVHMVPLASDSV